LGPRDPRAATTSSDERRGWPAQPALVGRVPRWWIARHRPLHGRTAVDWKEPSSPRLRQPRCLLPLRACCQVFSCRSLRTEKIQESLSALFENGEVEFEFRLLGRHGNDVCDCLARSPITNDGVKPSCTIGVARSRLRGARPRQSHLNVGPGAARNPSPVGELLEGDAFREIAGSLRRSGGPGPEISRTYSTSLPAPFRFSWVLREMSASRPTSFAEVASVFGGTTSCSRDRRRVPRATARVPR
jgi:hypothetical protein